MGARVVKRAVATVALILALGGCKSDEPGQAKDAGEQPASSETVEPKTSEAAEAKPTVTAVDKLFAYLPEGGTAVAYDRLGQRLDPAVIEVVFALPPKSADLLDERELLDEGLDIVLDGDADPGNWLTTTSLGFTLPVSKTPYFLRPLSKPAAELGPLLEQGFHKTESEGVEVWLPTGSFPWRIALLEGEVAAFIPVDIVGTGLAPLLEASKVERPEAGANQLMGALAKDPFLELVLISAQPLVHFDVDQTITQVEFGLRRREDGKDGYEGQVVLTPSGDIERCVEQLRARKHPEENQQVQRLLAAVEFVPQPEQAVVLGRLALEPDQLKHFLDL